MMKKAILFATILALGATAIQGADVKKTAPAKAPAAAKIAVNLNEFGIWCPKNIDAVKTIGKDSIKVEVKKNIAKRNAFNIQSMIIYSEGFKAGTNYRMTYTAKASENVVFYTAVQLAKGPWTTTSGRDVKLVKNVPQKIVLNFSFKNDIAKGSFYRVPIFALGNANPGTVFEFSGFTFEQVK